MNASAQSPTVLVINPGADVYGSDLQMLESVTALREAGARVVVACAGDGPLVAMLRERGAETVVGRFPVVRRTYLSPVGVGRLAGELARDLPAMVRLLRQLRPAALYVNTTTLPWWILLGRLARTQVVCHVHEAEDKDNQLVLKGLNAPLLMAHRLILISATAADALWSLLPSLRDRSVVVMNGVPDRADPPVLPPRENAVVRLVVVSRLSPRKAQHTAVDALRVLVDRGMDARLELAGTPFPGYEWYEQQLRDQVRDHDLSDRVTFTGYVTPSSIAFDRADIVLAPSVREPFGNAVVEAQLAQRPIVAAAAGGHRESIAEGETGLLVGVEDHVAMADAVELLAADLPTADAMGRAARISAMEHFGLARYRREIAEATLEWGPDRDNASTPVVRAIG